MTNKLFSSSFHKMNYRRSLTLPKIDSRAADDNAQSHDIAAPSSLSSWKPVSDQGPRRRQSAAYYSLLPSRAGANFTAGTTIPSSVTSPKSTNDTTAAAGDNNSPTLATGVTSSSSRRARRTSTQCVPIPAQKLMANSDNSATMPRRHKGNSTGSIDETPSSPGSMLPRLTSLPHRDLLASQTEPPEPAAATRAGNSSYRLSQIRRTSTLTDLPKETISSPKDIQAQSPVILSKSPPKIINQEPAAGPSFITQGRRRLQPLMTSDGVSNDVTSTKSMSHIEGISPKLSTSETCFEAPQSRGNLPRRVKSSIGEQGLQNNQADIDTTRTCDSDDASAADDERKSLRHIIRRPRRSVTFIVADTASSANDAGTKDPVYRSWSSFNISSFTPRDVRIMQAVADSAFDIDSAGVEDPRQALADNLGSVLVGEMFGENGTADKKEKWEIEADLMAQKEIEELRMKAAEEEKAVMARLERQREETRRQMEELELEKKNMQFNSVKNAAGRLLARMKSWKKRAVSSFDEEMDASTKDVQLERRVEAVFVSYARFGHWNPHEGAMWLPQDCKGIACDKFLDLARDAKLLKQSIPLQEARNVFCKHNNVETGYLEFQNFIVAISELAELDNKEAVHGITSVLKLNTEKYMLIHEKSDIPN